MPSIRERLRRRWHGPGGSAEVIRLAYPLVLSQMSFTLQVFVDRLFLTWYSADAVAGAVTALFVTWTIVGLFIGAGEYVTTFVAQYLGAERPRRIGAAVWQGVYFAVAAGVLTAALSPLSGPVFAMTGHEPPVIAHEIVYGRLILLGAFPIVLMATLSTFFAGRGVTLPILLVNIGATLLNGVLDYLWIFGHGGFPRAGVAGAALATITSQAAGCVAYAVLILRARHRRAYGTLSGWRFDPDLFRRLVRYGVPAGLQFSMEIMAFSIFMIVVGRIGTAELAASGIAFNLNMIVFHPMLGCAMAATSLVGRYLGAERPDLAERSAWSTFWACLVYMLACCALYVSAPGLLLAPYAAGADPATFARVGEMAQVLLRFVAVYSLFDMMNVIFAAALKGAGDTRFPVTVTVVLSFAVMVLPAYALCVVGGAGVYTAWTAASAYIFVNGLVMLRRFRGGAWKRLRIIERATPELPLAVGE